MDAGRVDHDERADDRGSSVAASSIDDARLTTDDAAGAGPSFTTIAAVAFAVLGFTLGSGKLGDNSFFWHLRTGRWMLDHGVPREDPFSYTAPGHAWTAQSWLAELWYGLLDAVGGPVAIRLVCGLVGAAIAVSLLLLAVRIVGDFARGLGLALGALVASVPLWSERPLFFGLAALVAVVWVVEVPDSPLGRRPVLSLTLLLWLWANVHGSFALGVAYLAAHLVGRALDGHPVREGRERLLLVGSALGLAAGLVNPYGPALLLFPLQLMGRGQVLAHVVEWKSPDFRLLHGMAFALWIVVLVWCLARGEQRPSRRDLLVAIPFLLLGFWARRNLILVPVVTLPVAARAIARPARPGPRTGAGVSARARRLVLTCLLVVGLVGAVDGLAQPSWDFRQYPVGAFDALERDGLMGRRLLTDDAWAGYVILEHWPEQQVFVDDRFDMYPLPVLDDYLTLSEAGPGWDDVLARWDIETVVWPADHPLVALMESTGDWRVIEADDMAVALVRRDITT